MINRDIRLLYLVRKAKKGDMRSFDLIMEDLEPDIKKKINHFYIRGSDFGDVLQESRIGLLKAIEDFEEQGGMAFRYFAINLCVPRRLITQINSANRNKYKLQNESISLSFPVLTESNESEQHLEDFIEEKTINMLDDMIEKEERAILENSLLNKLTELEMSVYLKYIEEYSYKDIALCLDKPIKTVDNALMRIRKKAKEALCEYQKDMEL